MGQPLSWSILLLAEREVEAASYDDFAAFAADVRREHGLEHGL